MSIDYSMSASETDGDFGIVFLLAYKKSEVDEPSMLLILLDRRTNHLQSYNHSACAHVESR